MPNRGPRSRRSGRPARYRRRSSFVPRWRRFSAAPRRVTRNANPVLFGVTWEWDGAHWTARQDIGVSARFGHAMAFDTIRQRAVLFGGLGRPDNADPAGPTKGDTWEHADVVNAAAGPRLASLDATPSPISAGQTLIVSVQLAGARERDDDRRRCLRRTADDGGGHAAVDVDQHSCPDAEWEPDAGIPRVIAVPLPAPLIVTARIGQGPPIGTTVVVS